MWLFFILSAWLVLSIPLALLIGSVIRSNRLDESPTTSAANPEQKLEQPPDNGRPHPQRRAA